MRSKCSLLSPFSLGLPSSHSESLRSPQLPQSDSRILRFPPPHFPPCVQLNQHKAANGTEEAKMIFKITANHLIILKKSTKIQSNIWIPSLLFFLNFLIFIHSSCISFLTYLNLFEITHIVTYQLLVSMCLVPTAMIFMLIGGLEPTLWVLGDVAWGWRKDKMF